MQSINKHTYTVFDKSHNVHSSSIMPSDNEDPHQSWCPMSKYMSDPIAFLCFQQMTAIQKKGVDSSRSYHWPNMVMFIYKEKCREKIYFSGTNTWINKMRLYSKIHLKKRTAFKIESYQIAYLYVTLQKYTNFTHRVFLVHHVHI